MYDDGWGAARNRGGWIQVAPATAGKYLYLGACKSLSGHAHAL